MFVVYSRIIPGLKRLQYASMLCTAQGGPIYTASTAMSSEASNDICASVFVFVLHPVDKKITPLNIRTSDGSSGSSSPKKLALHHALAFM